MTTVREELEKLGAIDRQLVRLKKILDAMPLDIARRQEFVEVARATRDEMQGLIRGCAMEVDRLNLDVQASEHELRDLDKKIGIIKNTKEYQIVTGRIAELKQQVSVKETRELEIMQTLEEHRAELNKRTAALEAEEKNVAGLRDTFEQETADIRKQQAALAEQRKQQIERVRQVAPEALPVYSQALKKGKGEGLADVKAGVCQGCYRRLQPNVLNMVMQGGPVERCICAGCGRILCAAPESVAE